MPGDDILVGVISDTHGLLRDEAVALLEGVDQIVHAGDIGRPEIIARLEAIAPVSAIRGNVDVGAWASAYPAMLRTRLFGRTVIVVHDRNDLPPGPVGAELVISGHSHRAGIEEAGGVLYLNPGSAGPRRFRLPVTLATVDLCTDRLVPTIHTIG